MIDKVIEEIIDYIKGYGKVIKLKIDVNDIAFIVEGRNEDHYIELKEMMYRTNNTNVSKNKIMKKIMNNYVNITEKYEQSKVEYGDFVNFIKKQGCVGTYAGVVEQVNTLARTVDVKYKSTDGELEYCTIPLEHLVRIKTVTLKEMESNKIEDNDDVITKENIENIRKNTKQNDENMIKLNKENNYNIEENVGVKPIKKISTNT